MSLQGGMPSDPIIRQAMLRQMQQKELSVNPDVATMEQEQAAAREAAMLEEQKALAEQSSKAQNGGAASKTGEKLSTVGGLTGNPYVAGAGIALQGLGMVDDAVRKNEQAQIDAYNNKIMAQRSAIRNIFS